MQKETKLEEILRFTLESLKKQEYSTETLQRYQKKFNALNSFAHSRGFLSHPMDCFTNILVTTKISIPASTLFLRNANVSGELILSNLVLPPVKRIPQGKKGRSACDDIQTERSRKELDRFITTLEEEPLQPNTINTYKRIVAYLSIYCEKKSYRSINELVSGDIRNFIVYLYEQGHFKPTTITSGLSGLKRFLSLHTDIEHLIMELPIRLPR